MTNNRFLPARFFVSFTIIILFFVFTWFSFSCKTAVVPPYQGKVLRDARTGLDSMKRWVTWNILFNSGADSQSRESGILSIEDSIRRYLKARNSTWDARFYIFYCPCDSLLFNLGATPVDGVGTSIIPPPPPPPPPGGSGDIVYVSNNNYLEQEDSVEYSVTNKSVILNPATTGTKQILAVIDTGLDTTLFSQPIQKLIWRPSSGLVLFNFVGGNQEDFRDDHVHKHGTALTALALHAMGTSPKRPRLMILKALDRNKQGTTFTVSCALSYAIKNQATVINASLGYYEDNSKVDSIFRHYIDLCNNASIVIFAAAGNAPGGHDPSKLCDSAINGRELTDSHLFYPACFSTTMPNLISVTGLATRGACFYQNFSPTYISLGVLNDTHNSHCCSYFIPFLTSGFEGSSYATPIACGTMMACLIDGTPGRTMSICIENNTQTDPRWLQITKNGRILLYSDDQTW